jgi:hypothetical protein
MGFRYHRHRPIGAVNTASYSINPSIAPAQPLIANFAKPLDPTAWMGVGIKFVAMTEQKRPAIGTAVHLLTMNLDPMHYLTVQSAQRSIVVAWNVDHATTGLSKIKQLCHYCLMALRPGATTTQVLKVNDVTDQIPGVSQHALKEVQQIVDFAIRRS